jgi:hypothetical protein
MAAMVLALADVQAEFQDLEEDVAESGPVDAASAAEGTIDPVDTAESLELSGFVDGYASSFSHPEDIFFVQSIITVFDSSRSARSFISKELQDLRRYEGQNIEGAILRSTEEFDAAVLGDGAVGARVTASLAFADIMVTSVMWLRDTAVLSVDIISVEVTDYNAASLRLGQRMDARVQGVMTGEIPATPAPTPGPPGNQSGRDAAISQGYDLQAMALSRQEISLAAIIASSGYDEVTDSVASFSQEITARADVFDNGASQLVSASLTISLEESAAQARSPIEIAKQVDPEVFGEAIGQVLAESSGITPEEITAERMTLPALGDDSVGFDMNVKTSSGNFDSQVVVFARGRVIVQMVLVGREGEVLPEDTIDLAAFILDKVIRNSPP